MADMDIVINRPANFSLETLEKMLAEIEEVHIVPIPATINPMTQVKMVDCCLYLVLLVMLMVVFTKKNMRQ